MNTNSDAYKMATQTLERHKTPEKALKPFVLILRRRGLLLQQIALEFLTAIGPISNASKSKEKTEPKPTQEEGSVKISPFGVPAYRRRTREEKQIALMARGRMADAVYEARSVNGKPIGDLSWGQLRSLVEEQAYDAASYLREGREATSRAILLGLIEQYAVVDDMKRKVRDVVPPDPFGEMIEKADAAAPVFIEKFMHQYADSLKGGNIEIENESRPTN